MFSIDFLFKTQVLLKLPKVHAQRTHGRTSWDRLGGGTGWKQMMLRGTGGGLWMSVCGCRCKFYWFPKASFKDKKGREL